MEAAMTAVSLAMAQRGLKPVSILAAGRPHGDRLRYVAGCRCAECRAANAAYERGRQAERAAGNWNGVVSAERARHYLKQLSAQGVGRRAVAEASDVSHSILTEVRTGRRTQIRALTERRILAVTVGMALDHALIPAGPTWRLIGELTAAGFSQVFLAQRLGYKRALQFDRKEVTVRNAARVRRLHRELIDSDEALVSSKAAANSRQRELRVIWFPSSRSDRRPRSGRPWKTRYRGWRCGPAGGAASRR